MRLAQINIVTPGTVFTDSDTLLTTAVSRILLFAIPLAGLIFLVMIIASGFTMLTSVGEPGKIQSATKTLTNSLIGLLLVIAAYFIIQILEAVFGLTIL